jgi:hypothetical protein
MPLDTLLTAWENVMMRKRLTPSKKSKKPKRPSRPDFAQNALASVEKAIGGKLAQGMRKR